MYCKKNGILYYFLNKILHNIGGLYVTQDLNYKLAIYPEKLSIVKFEFPTYIFSFPD